MRRDALPCPECLLNPIAQHGLFLGYWCAHHRAGGVFMTSTRRFVILPAESAEDVIHILGEALERAQERLN